MQPSPETLQMLGQCFLQSLSPEPEPRKQAESYLKQSANQAGYGITVLHLLSSPGVDAQIRQSAAVNFKNHVKYHWAPTDRDVERLGELLPVQDSEKEQIRVHIVELMLSMPAKIQIQLSDALTIMSDHDFPEKWPNLLPELVSKLDSQDYMVVNGVLQTANSIFKRFRHQYRSNELYIVLRYCLDLFAMPLLQVFVKTGLLISANGGAPDLLRPLFESQRLVARIFNSLNSQELPEVFEDHMGEWMTEFHRYLTYENPSLVETGDKESVVDQLKAAICENIQLYMEKSEEEFGGFVTSFVKDVWELLKKVEAGTKHDQVAITGMKFLTTVSLSVHHTLFADPASLQSMCEGIIIPNLTFRDEDEELFDMNPVEYIRRDMEGSDSDTRRRMACELLKGLAAHYEQQITSLFSQHVASLLSQYAANPAENWKHKDCAIYIVVALAVRQKTVSAGATSVNQLVNIGEFFSAHILPELTAQDVNDRPVIKADALKFLTMFRSQLPKQATLELLPQLFRYTSAESNVVHSYAANCIERFLVVKDAGVPRFASADIQPHVESLLTSLFGALELPDSKENPYVMKCLMRVVSMTTIGPLGPPIMTQLSKILLEVCQNPRNPTFNHYLFEAVAALIRRSALQDQAQIALFEESLFPVLQTVLGQDVQEFAPYVFQVLALLVESRRPPLPESYLRIFPPLVTPLLWERPANVPALVRLLQAYLQKASSAIVSSNQLSSVLGVFQKLIISKHTDHHGFFILNTIVENLSFQELAPYLPQIWTLLFHRLQSSRVPKFVRGLLVFLALFVAKHGTAAVVESVNSVQPGVFLQLVDPVWVPTLPNISGEVETKLCTVAATRVLTECADLQADAALHLWGRLLDSLVLLVIRPEEERSAAADEADEAADLPGAGEMDGYTAVYAQLHNAGKVEEDPVAAIPDARQFLCQQLNEACKRRPQLTSAVKTGLKVEHLQALQGLCSSYGVALG
eukprot:TRINITY_DN9424_c0_g1_i1.p1 TRINITY_DN9424_c0_g1~~TRINITY_DN9424_c0_g1_i1.p1  ORF type:complete len:976 (+),score=170.09 TRINITY_DN9424_c0_g1_i1:234-3161(+)